MNLSKAFDRSNRKFLTENVDTYSLSNDTLKLLYGQTAFDKNQAQSITFLNQQKTFQDPFLIVIKSKDL